METLGAVVVGAAMVVGLAMTVVPFVPGLLIIWIAGVLHALTVGFDGPTWTLLGLLTVLAVVGSGASLVLPHSGAASGGASGAGLAGGVAGALVGIVVIPVLGLPIGGVLGLLFVERLRTGDTATAWKITKGAIKGFGLGAIVEILCGVLMVAGWLAWVVWW